MAGTMFAGSFRALGNTPFGATKKRIALVGTGIRGITFCNPGGMKDPLEHAAGSRDGGHVNTHWYCGTEEYRMWRSGSY